MGTATPHWPKLDIDLAVDPIDHPERFPLVSKHRANARANDEVACAGVDASVVFPEVIKV